MDLFFQVIFHQEEIANFLLVEFLDDLCFFVRSYSIWIVLVSKSWSFFKGLLSTLFFLFVVFPLNILQQVLTPPFEHEIFKSVLLIFLPRFMKIIHIQLHNGELTCRTNDV